MHSDMHKNMYARIWHYKCPFIYGDRIGLHPTSYIVVSSIFNTLVKEMKLKKGMDNEIKSSKHQSKPKQLLSKPVA